MWDLRNRLNRQNRDWSFGSLKVKGAVYTSTNKRSIHPPICVHQLHCTSTIRFNPTLLRTQTSCLFLFLVAIETWEGLHSSIRNLHLYVNEKIII